MKELFIVGSPALSPVLCWKVCPNFPGTAFSQWITNLDPDLPKVCGWRDFLMTWLWALSLRMSLASAFLTVSMKSWLEI